MNLAAKYRPKSLDDITEQSLVVQMVNNLCTSSNLETRNFLFTGPAGCGKAQPLTSLVLTPSGFVSMGDIKVGQEVFTANGNVAKVSGVFPQGDRDIYRIYLSDNTHIDVADNHLNVVYTYNYQKHDKKYQTVNTLELITKLNDTRKIPGKRLYVDIPKIDFAYKDVPINPYLFGILIGGCYSDTTVRRIYFHSTDSDIVDKVNSILKTQYNLYLKKYKDNTYIFSPTFNTTSKYLFSYSNLTGVPFKVLIAKLIEDGYPYFHMSTLVKIANNSARNTLIKYPDLKNKISCYLNPNYRCDDEFYNLLYSTISDFSVRGRFIPDIYLLNNEQVRTELVRGLFDTKVYFNSSSSIFKTTNKRLSDNVEFLFRSLGIRDYTSVQKASVTGFPRSDWYVHILGVSDILNYCSIDRVISRFSGRTNRISRFVDKIEYIGKQSCQCIMVDHSDHTYISETGFIPTHNTTICRVIANILNEGHGQPIEIDAASHSGVDAMREIVSQAGTYPVGCNWKIFIIDECHSISNQGWQTLLKTLEEGPAKTIFLLATTNPEKIPATILSRVQTFQLSKISLSGIENRLKYIVDCENKEGKSIVYEDVAIAFIAKMANGGMRDAITLLEKSISYSSELSSRNVVSALGLPNYDDFFALLQAYAKKDNACISNIIDKIYNSGINFIKWMQDFHAFVVNVMKYIFVQDISKTTIPVYYTDKISKYTTSHSAICLQLAAKLIRLNQELRSTQYLQELALTYLCFNPKK